MPSAFVVLLWLIFGFDYLFSLDLARFAVEPRTWQGLLGILFFPLLHGNLEHIAANSIAFIGVLGSGPGEG